MKKILCILFTFSLSLFTLTGCGPFWVNPYIEVKESQLNWVNIHYYNMKREPFRRIGVYINGAGHVEVRKGISELVSNDFAKHYQEESWDKIETRRLSIDPKHARDIFQQLVNYGLLDSEKFCKGTTKGKYDRFIAVKANIDSITYSENVNIFDSDPDLAEILLDTVREFDNPAKMR